MKKQEFKKLSKEECIQALKDYTGAVMRSPNSMKFDEINHKWILKNRYQRQHDMFQNLIEEYFDPQPYKFEEYYDGMFVWDDEWKQLRELMDAQDFEEGRFFPITKAMQYQEKE